jgi:hypothetical protein
LSIGAAIRIQPKKVQTKRGLFSSIFRCGQKEEVVQHIYQSYVQNTKVHLIPMGVCPGLTIKKYLGICDVHLSKQMRLIITNEEVKHVIEVFIEEANEVTKAKVQSLGGNFMLSYKIDINTLDIDVKQKEIFIKISIYGDVVLAESDSLQ